METNDLPTVEMTARQFERLIEENPGWAAELSHPVSVTGFVRMAGSPITHLSPWITFEGEEEGDSGTWRIWRKAADFSGCKSLKNAAGTFHGQVNFNGSNIEEIDPNLHVTGINHHGMAAEFRFCDNLRVAQGKFEGPVTFGSSIEEIQNIQLETYVAPNQTRLTVHGGEGKLKRVPDELLADPTVRLAASDRNRLLREKAAREMLGKPSTEATLL